MVRFAPTLLLHPKEKGCVDRGMGLHLLIDASSHLDIAKAALFQNQCI
jgi:hypothetical protein